jgi:hypothetical protein
MRRPITYIIVTALAAVLPSQRASAETAKEIVQKAIEAHGGADNLKKYPGVQMKSKGKMSVLNMDVDIESEETILLPDQFKNVMKMTVFGQKAEVVQIFNAGKMKMTANGMGVPISDGLKNELKNSMDVHAATEIYPLLDEKRFELSTIDKPEKDGDKEVVGVLVKMKNMQEIKLFFDAKSFLLVKAERKGLDPAEKEVDQQMLFRDYKKIDGIMRPMKNELLFDGKKTGSFEVIELKHLDKVDKKEFDISD